MHVAARDGQRVIGEVGRQPTLDEPQNGIDGARHDGLGIVRGIRECHPVTKGDSESGVGIRCLYSYGRRDGTEGLSLA